MALELALKLRNIKKSEQTADVPGNRPVGYGFHLAHR